VSENPPRPGPEAAAAAGTGEEVPERTAAEKAERALVIFGAAQSIGLGLLLAAAPQVGVRLLGFRERVPEFFVREAGMFLVVLAAIYVLEYARYRRVLFLVLAKTCAALFLLACVFRSDLPWTVSIAVVVEAGIASWAVTLHRWAELSRRGRAKLRLVHGKTPPGPRAVGEGR
jgi:uncharacterized membrane protein